MKFAENLAGGGAACGSEATLHPFRQKKEDTGEACCRGDPSGQVCTPKQEMTSHRNCCVPWQPRTSPGAG
eukprot:493653-Pelagomonas_calceolata.AAC.4